MIETSLKSLIEAGYSLEALETLIRVDMPAGYRAMTLHDGAALGAAAFSTQEMLNHVLEEEVLHLQQKASGKAEEFGPGTVRPLEEEIHEIRKFPAPE